MTWWHDQASRWPLLTPTQETLLGRQVREWLDHPDPVPPAIKRRGERARERFLRSNLRLVIGFAERYRSVPSQYHDDLIQAGNMGLMRAVEKFDPTRGYKFSTYAYWWIRQGIHAFLEQHGRCIRLPTTHSAQYTKITTAVLELQSTLGRRPTRSEVADHLNLTPEAIERITSRPVATLSLDQPNISSPDGGPIAEVIADPTGPLLEQVESAEQLQQILDAIALLEPHAQRIVTDQFLSATPSTITQLARAEGMRPGTISKILDRSIHLLRIILDGGSPYFEPPTCEPVEQGTQLALFGLLD
jgi:RNA polymerase sigma factor (sigma-70 family)